MIKIESRKNICQHNPVWPTYSHIRCGSAGIFLAWRDQSNDWKKRMWIHNWNKKKSKDQQFECIKNNDRSSSICISSLISSCYWCTKTKCIAQSCFLFFLYTFSPRRVKSGSRHFYVSNTHLGHICTYFNNILCINLLKSK